MVDELKEILPSTLASFKKSSGGRSMIPDFNGILALNLATECGIPIILPAACYYCSLLSTQTILEGFRLESGVVVKLSPWALSIALAFRGNVLAEIVRAMDISRSWKSRRWRCTMNACTMDLSLLLWMSKPVISIGATTAFFHLVRSPRDTLIPCVLHVSFCSKQVRPSFKMRSGIYCPSCAKRRAGRHLERSKNKSTEMRMLSWRRFPIKR